MNKPIYIRFNEKVFDKNNVKDIRLEKMGRQYVVNVEYKYQEDKNRIKTLAHTTHYDEASKVLNDVIALVNEETANFDHTFYIISTAKALSSCILREETKENAIAMLETFHDLILKDINEHQWQN